MPFWTYMLHCRDRTFYVGHADDLDRRVAQHHDGTLAGYTRSKRPVTLVWSEEFPTRYEALAAERQIKGWSRAKKLALIRGDWGEISRLARAKGRPSTCSGRTVKLESATNPVTVRPELVEGRLCLLVPNPSTPPRNVSAVRVELSVESDRLSLRFDVENAVSVAMPPRVPPSRSDELWRTTCFELFLRRGEERAYREFNFSPSTAWAAYAFDDYRSGMSNLPLTAPVIEPTESGLTIDIVTDLPDGPWHVGLSAVIEETDGAISYWALRHPPGPPDFHHPDCFALELPAVAAR